jgi:SEC-C motif
MSNLPNSLKPDAFARAAQGFLSSLLVTKATDPGSEILPFLHGHTLELAAKAAMATLGTVSPNHNVYDHLGSLQLEVPKLACLLPTPQDMADYKKVWIDGLQPNQNVVLPDPTTLDRLEVAYFIDNVTDLKYLSRKSGSPVSGIHISSPDLNSHFLKILLALREVFRTDELDDHLRQRLARFYADPAQKPYVDSLVKCEVPLPVAHTRTPPARNGLCPCGSTKKYKKCHGGS